MKIDIIIEGFRVENVREEKQVSTLSAGACGAVEVFVKVLGGGYVSRVLPELNDILEGYGAGYIIILGYIIMKKAQPR